MNWNTKQNQRLLEAILILDSKGEAKRFLRDLLTESEIKEFASRLNVAQMLNQKIPYSKIEKETGLSSTTVARISKWLNTGMDGYKLVIKKLHHHNSSSNLVRKGLS